MLFPFIFERDLIRTKFRDDENIPNTSHCDLVIYPISPSTSTPSTYVMLNPSRNAEGGADDGTVY